jgi:GR25 family glycosyltransferase involved in LPS biosynthesis
MHYSKLVDRKSHLQNNIKQVGLDKYPIIWVEQFDREIITPDIISLNYTYTPAILGRHLTLPEIANGIAHNYIIEQACKHNCILVLEDDIILKHNFTTYLENCLQTLPEDWEIFNIGGDYKHQGGFANDPSPIQSQPVVTTYDNCAMTCSYLLRNSAALRIVKHPLYRPFCMPIDTTLCFICPNIAARTYWCKPWIAYEGSKTPLFCTSLERGF